MPEHNAENHSGSLMMYSSTITGLSKPQSSSLPQECFIMPLFSAAAAGPVPDGVFLQGILRQMHALPHWDHEDAGDPEAAEYRLRAR